MVAGLPACLLQQQQLQLQYHERASPAKNKRTIIILYAENGTEHSELASKEASCCCASATGNWIEEQTRRDSQIIELQPELNCIPPLLVPSPHHHHHPPIPIHHCTQVPAVGLVWVRDNYAVIACHHVKSPNCNLLLLLLLLLAKSVKYGSGISGDFPISMMMANGI